MPPPPLKPKTDTLPAEQSPAPVSSRPRLKLVIHGEPGWGKTSLAASAPGAMFITAPLETGIKQLVAAKRVRPCPVVVPKNWSELIQSIREAAKGTASTIVVDALGGVQDMLVKYVTDQEFNGDFGEGGFMSYGKGWAFAARVFSQEFLMGLQACHDANKDVVLIAHTQVRSVQNPTGKDWDKSGFDAHREIASEVERWSTDIGFGQFSVTVDRDGKATGGTSRVLLFRNHPAYVAKTQTGFPERVDMGNDPLVGWVSLLSKIGGGS